MCAVINAIRGGRGGVVHHDDKPIDVEKKSKASRQADKSSTGSIGTDANADRSLCHGVTADEIIIM